LLLASIAFAFYLGDFASIAANLATATLGVASFGGLMVWLLVHPTREKLRFALPAFFSIGIAVGLAPIAGKIAWPLFLWPRQSELDQFVGDLVEYGRIHDMSDGLRYYKSVNGKNYDSSHERVDSASFPSLALVLASEQIEPVKYDEFRRRLISLGFIEVAVTETHVALLYDGFLDNLHGVLWVRPGCSPPSEGSSVFATDLVSLRDLGGGWFAFETT
jgi:hypothetical protein